MKNNGNDNPCDVGLAVLPLAPTAVCREASVVSAHQSKHKKVSFSNRGRMFENKYDMSFYHTNAHSSFLGLPQRSLVRSFAPQLRCEILLQNVWSIFMVPSIDGC